LIRPVTKIEEAMGYHRVAARLQAIGVSSWFGQVADGGREDVGWRGRVRQRNGGGCRDAGVTIRIGQGSGT